MKAILLQENLNKALSVVSRFVGSNLTLSVLENILFTANKEGLEISATDLETGIVFWIPAKVEKEGTFALPAKKISEFISSLPTEEVTLSQQKDKITISCKNYNATFNTINTEGFPEIPTIKKKQELGNIFNLNIKNFIDIVSQVAFAAANDESRPVLNGVRFSVNNKKLQLVATDGYRLSLETISLKEKIEMPVTVIPARSLEEVVRVLTTNEKEEEFKMAFTKKNNQVIFSFEGIEIVTRIIDGTFPDFEKIIPKEGESKLKIDKEALDKAIRTASIFARESANIIKLESKAGKLKISANAPQIGDNQINLDVKQEGPDFQIAFNWRFLQDFLSAFSEEEILFEGNGSLQPGLFRSPKKSSFLHIIMPVRVES